MIERLSGPRWIGIHSCCSNSVVGSNSPRANAGAGSASAKIEAASSARASRRRLLAVVAEQREAEFGGIGERRRRARRRGRRPCRTRRPRAARPARRAVGTSSRRPALPSGEVIGRRLQARQQQPERLRRRPRARPRSAQPLRLQPATRKTGSASTITSAPARSAAAGCDGVGRGAPRIPTRIRRRSGTCGRRRRSRAESRHGADEDPDPDRARGPADERAHADAGAGRAEEEGARSCGLEGRARRLHAARAYQSRPVRDTGNRSVAVSVRLCRAIRIPGVRLFLVHGSIANAATLGGGAAARGAVHVVGANRPGYPPSDPARADRLRGAGGRAGPAARGRRPSRAATPTAA